ncbi:Carnitine O-acetyltransferase mitochondrial, partial [Tulasnella sp. 417]
ISKDGRLLSVAEIERQLQHIYDNSTEGPEVGVLTSNHRDTWAKDYASLVAGDPQNARTLEDIVTAAFVVCLDTAQPASPLELSKLAFHGGENGEMLGNRWWDKPAQIIICDNAEAAYVGEHSVMDGTPSVTMVDRMLSAIKSPDFDHGNTENQVMKFAPPSLLEWKTTPSIQNAIASARKAADASVGKQDMGMTSTSYGRDAIKTFGFSPDAWAQMVIQLAYHRLVASTSPQKTGRRRNGGTYEAASTRGFLKGRTETIRTVTEESMAWCDSMDDSSTSEEERKRLFKAATKRHGEDAGKAVKAMGVDRHLFGLQKVLKPGEDVPELFKDPLFVRAKTWIVSTSAIFSPHFTRGYGWGQVVPNGFGVAYMTGFPDELKFTVTSQKDQPNAQFVRELEKAAGDLKSLFESQDSSLKSNIATYDTRKVMTKAPVARFDDLPPELCLFIARLSTAQSDHRIQDTVRISNINSRTRNIVINTPDLWRKFSLAGSASSHGLGRHCVHRAGNQPMDLVISLPKPMEQDKIVYGFLNCFKLAAPRIARLDALIGHPSSLDIVKALLSQVELPTLKDITVKYVYEDHEGFDRWILLPSCGANLRTISLIGIQTQPFSQLDLENLTSLYLGAGKHWRWMGMSLATFLPAAKSVQDLYFAGEEGMFHTSLNEDDWDLADSPLTLPALRRVHFVDTAPSFMTSFLHQVNAPLLEEVDMTAPLHGKVNEEGREVFADWIAAVRSIRHDPARALPAHTLKLHEGDVEYDPREMFTFALFLMVAFPNITSLEIEGDFYSILHICGTLADRQSQGTPKVWSSIEKLKVSSVFDQDSDEDYGEFVAHLAGSLQSLKEKRVMNLQELRLSVDQSLRPPKGRVSVEALSKLVGVLILDD